MAHTIKNFYQLNELFTEESYKEGRRVVGIGSIEIYAWKGTVIHTYQQYLSALYEFFTSVYINGYSKERSTYAAKYQIEASSLMGWESIFDKLFEGKLNLTSLIS